MTTITNEIIEHYAVEGLDERILAALEGTGRSRDAVSVDDLAPVDEFHLRGREATDELSALVPIDASARVLDVGSGLGGTARLLASRHGCHVTGIDLTESFCATARSLSARVGLGHKTEFVAGDATALPFEDASFDVVWTEHVQMNIADKHALYGEIARVLKPGGRLAFHDIFAGPARAPTFPMPWADDPRHSFLVEPEEAAQLLDRLGLRASHTVDSTARSAAWLGQAFARMKEHGPPPIGLHLIMGASAKVKLSNLLAALEGGHVVTRIAVHERAQ